MELVNEEIGSDPRPKYRSRISPTRDAGPILKGDKHKVHVGEDTALSENDYSHLGLNSLSDL